MDRLEKRAKELLTLAGITLNGNNPWDIQVHDKTAYQRVFSHGSLGLGESYVDGQWDCDDLPTFFTKVLRSDIHESVKKIGSFFLFLRARITNMQTRKRAPQVAKEHYDIGNDLYVRMLDPWMQYTCGYWKEAKNLNEAQEAKLHLICKKLGLKEGTTLLDIGCGWGNLARFAAQHYGARVTGITLSKEQLNMAQELCKGLPVEIRLEDYRDTKGTFDRVVSVGMFEHVGYKNYRTYMQKVHDLLNEDGLFLLHTIGSKKTVFMGEPWLHKYIFPNGMLPSVAQVGKAINGLFIMEDWHNFGADYEKTLIAWFENFDRAWPELKDKYGERFYRMWKYYLLCMAGTFRARHTHLWQIVLSKKGVLGGYESLR